MSPGLFKQDAEERSAPPTARPTPRPVDRQGRRDSTESSLSVLGPGLEIVGDVKARGTVQLEGRVEGTLDVEGQLTVSRRGSIDGDVTADEIVVGGRIDGSVVARDVARLHDGCRVRADVKASRLELQEGGILQGRVDMQGGREGEKRTPGTNVPRSATASGADDRGTEKEGEEKRKSDAA